MKKLNKMTDLIIKSKIKEAVPELNVSSEVAEVLNRKVETILREAADRAKANGRRTLQGRDI